jgi:hypothetical protein
MVNTDVTAPLRNRKLKKQCQITGNRSLISLGSRDLPIPPQSKNLLSGTHHPPIPALQQLPSPIDLHNPHPYSQRRI